MRTTYSPVFPRLVSVLSCPKLRLGPGLEAAEENYNPLSRLRPGPGRDVVEENYSPLSRLRPGTGREAAEENYSPAPPISLSPFIPKLPTSLQKQLEIDFGFQR